MSVPQENAQRIHEHLLQAETLFRQKEYRRTLDLLSSDFRLLADDPAAIPAEDFEPVYFSLVVNLTDIHMILGNFEVAERMAKECMAKAGAPLIAKTHCEDILANLFSRTGRHKESVAMLIPQVERMQKEGKGEHDPSLAEKYHLLIVNYCAMGAFEDAEQSLDALERIANVVKREGHPDATEITNLLDNATDFLKSAKSISLQHLAEQESVAELSLNQSPVLEDACWRYFCRREFSKVVQVPLDIEKVELGIRMIAIRAIARLGLGEEVSQVEEEAFQLSQVGSSERVLVECILGHISPEEATSSLGTASERCQLYFYAAMVALLNRDDTSARSLLASAETSEDNLPERQQAAVELEALDRLARDIKDFDAARQREIEATYRYFCDYNWMNVLPRSAESFIDDSATPQLLLLYVASVQALGDTKLAESLIPHYRRQLLHWPWHARMLDVIIGRTSSQELIPFSSGPVETCQVNYYSFVAHAIAGRWEEAEHHLSEVLAVSVECSEASLARLNETNHEAKLENLNRVAVYLSQRGEFDLAERAAHRGLALAERKPATEGQIIQDLTLNLASILNMSGKLSESIDLFEELIALPSLSGLEQLVISLNLGQVFLDENMHTQARFWLERAFARFQENEVSTHVKAALFNAMGRLDLSGGNPERAIGWATAATEQLDEDVPPLTRAIVTDNLAAALARSGRFEDALDRHLVAAEMMKDQPSHPSSIKIAGNTSWSLWQLGRYEEALELQEDALRRCGFPDSESHSQTHSVLTQSALFLSASGKTTEALDRLIAASRIEDGLVGEKMTLRSDELRMSYANEALFSLSLILSAARRLTDSEQRLEEVLDIVLRRKALVALAGSVRRDVVLGGRYPSLRPILEEYHSLKNLFDSTAFETADDPDIGAKIARFRHLEASLAKSIPELRISTLLRDTSVRRILDLLPASWSLIEFVRVGVSDFTFGPIEDGFFGPEHYFAFVIPSTRADHIKLVDLGPAEAMDFELAEYLARLDEQNSPKTNELRAAVLSRLVLPLFSLLPSSGHVLIAADGFLARLPFEILPAGGGNFLIDNYSFSYVTTIRDMLRSSVAASIEKPAADIVVANPDFGPPNEGPAVGNFEPLPGTEDEAEMVSNLLGVRPWLGANAVKKRLVRQASPRILHIATHGFLSPPQQNVSTSNTGGVIGPYGVFWRSNIDDSLRRSGLALAGANKTLGASPGTEAEDALLTALDVMKMDLTGTQLVVLSACDTGRGTLYRGEGTIGIRSAFQLAGAKTVIVSMWKLPDKQTSVLMRGFYQRILRGMACFDAMRAAQLELRRDFPLPFYWGAFVCFGDAGTIRGTTLTLGEDEEVSRLNSLREQDEAEQWTLVLSRNPDSSEALLQRGLNYHNLRRFAEAITDFDSAILLSPNSAELYYNRGFSHSCLGRTEQALGDFNRALEKDPEFARAYHRRGLLFAKLGDDDAALEDFGKALELSPDDPHVFYHRANFFADRAQFHQAVEDYSSSIRLKPNYQFAYVNRATIYVELNRLEAAIADLRTAIELDPGDALAHLNLGSALAKNGQSERAIESWEAAASVGGANIVSASQQMIDQFKQSEEGSEIE